MPDFTLRPLTDNDRPWVTDFIAEHWGEDSMIVHGQRYVISGLPGFVAEMDGVMVIGLVTYRLVGSECEVMSLDSLREGLGVGGALLQAVIAAARGAGCRRVYLSTTNDNLHALRFYQRRGFTLVGLRPGAVTESRKLKPSIPFSGVDGIPIRDEIELELRLS